MNTILLATDGSSSAKRATAKAIELAKATGWTLRVVTVWHLPTYVYGYAPLPYVPELAEEGRQHAADIAAAAVEDAHEAGVAATSEIRDGDPAEEICAAIEEAGADIVVLGAHGWGRVQRLVFGSVSSSVLHRASCPVLVVREAAAGEKDEPAVVGASRSEPG